MKLSDYIIDFLVSIGVKHVFLITGGAASHLVDSFHNRKDIRYICVQHEQAAAMAADAYSRLGDSIGVVITTSGPGATNLLTGTGCSWFDSIPCLYLTGQVNTYEYKGGANVRQVGFQETDIVNVIKPLTKFAHLVNEPHKIRYFLEKAVYIAKSGRPGPVLLDLPMDIQRASIDPAVLKRFSAKEIDLNIDSDEALRKKIDKCLSLIKSSRRPVIVAGGGIRNARATSELKTFAGSLGFPVVATLCGLDSFDHRNPLYAGFLGVYGQRGANFTVANSDLLIGIGTRFDSRQTGTGPHTFARAAKKIVVDIDREEFNRRVIANIAIASDAKRFLSAINKKIKNLEKPDVNNWLRTVGKWKNKYSIHHQGFSRKSRKINPYVFLRKLSEELSDDSIVTLDTGANLIWSAQTLEIKAGQRVFTAGGMSPMGYALPAAIGASVYAPKKPVICIVGDGGMQLNLQELQTISYYKLPVKIFIFNNHSYGMVRQFQDMYFDSRHEATDIGGGYSCPDFIKIGKAFGLNTSSIKGRNLRDKIKWVLKCKKAVLCNVDIDEEEQIIPKLEVNKPIEDQTPYLTREEFLANMVIEPY